MNMEAWVLKNCKFASKEAEMEKFFEKRTKNHISLVGKAIAKIVAALPEFSELSERAAKHDESKFSEPEHSAYLWITWKHKCEKDGDAFECPEGMKDKMNDATLHHFINNRHHPEFHLEDPSEAKIDPKDRDKSKKCVDASKMPPLDIAEMVADWQAMSEELGKNTARQWYDKQKNVRWKFSPKQDELIDRLLSVFD